MLTDVSVANGETTSTVEPIELHAGEFVDLVVDGRASVTSDTFYWNVTLAGTPSETAAETYGGPREFSSAAGLRGPEAGAVDRRVVAAWRLTLLRDPDSSELEAVAGWMNEVVSLDRQASDRAAAIEQALESLCQTLLGSNEFLYVE